MLLLLVPVLALLFQPVPVSASVYHLEIEPVITKGAEGKVEFRPITDGEPVPESTIAWADAACSPPISGIKVCVDQGKTEPNRWHQSEYVFYVLTGLPTAIQIKFSASTASSFPDQIAEARFSLTSDRKLPGTTDENKLTGTLQVPVYSPSQMDLLSIDDANRGYEKSSLHGEQILRVAFRNRSDLDIIVAEPPVVQCDTNLWERCDIRYVNLRTMGKDKVLPLSSTIPVLEIHAIPKSFKALGTSLLPSTFAAGDSTETDHAAHDHLTFSVSYRTRGGFERLFAHSLPVRFVPGFWSLLLAVIAGCLVGSLIPFFFGHVAVRDWSKLAAAAILLSIVVEALAMLVVKLDSTIQIFRFKLDPFQILPAALLGVLVGLRGSRNAVDLEKVIQAITAGGRPAR